MATATEVEPAPGDVPRRRRAWPLALAGLALAGAGLGGIGASRTAGPSARVLGRNLPITAGATDRLQVFAHNSPSLVANPKNRRNLAVVNRVDSPSFSCAAQFSLDGGARWTTSQLPAVPEAKTVGCFSPDAAFGSDGTLYVSFSSFAPVEGLGTIPDAVWVASSADGGANFSAPVRAAGPAAYQVRLVADPVRASIYLTWLEARESGTWGFSGTGNPLLVTRSDDRGATWPAPVRVSPPARQRVVAPSLAVGVDGALFVAYLDVGDDRLDYAGGHEGRGGEPYPGRWALVVARSFDQGVSWQEALVEPRLVPTQRFLQLFPPAPSLVVDDEGRVFVGFHDGRLGDADVWVWASKDGARTWGPARRVNDTRPRDRRSQYLPRLAVAPGRLDVVYYDRRGDKGDLRNTVSVQSSFDGARTFTPSVAMSDGSFDVRVGYGRDRDMPDLGSRLGLLSTSGGALAVWTDTRQAEELIDKQVLARAVVAITPPDPPRTALRVAGVLFTLLGLVVLALPLKRLVGLMVMGRGRGSPPDPE